VTVALEALDEPVHPLEEALLAVFTLFHPLDQANLRLSETAYEVCDGGNMSVILGDLLVVLRNLLAVFGDLLIVFLRGCRQLRLRLENELHRLFEIHGAQYSPKTTLFGIFDVPLAEEASEVRRFIGIHPLII
jgi:hypothetical protein